MWNSVFVGSAFVKALTFENAYKILTVIHTVAELYPSFGALGPWFIVILEQGLLWTKHAVSAV